MNINELPEEILARILSFLSRSDRLESALTCRRWAQTVARAPPLLRDVWLVIRGIPAKRGKEAETVFANSQRQYENLRFEQAYLRFYKAIFWSNVGPTLRQLKIPGPLSSGKFYSILKACPNLESLYIYGRLGEATMFQSSELPQGTNLESIQKSTRNMRYLRLDYSLNADVLEYLLTLMPSVSSIGLENCGGIADVPSRLPNTLGASRKITLLDLSCTNINPGDCEQLLRMSSDSLQILQCHEDIVGFVPTVFDALGKCSMLRVLHLDLSRVSDTGLLQNILRNLPELESFSILNAKSDTTFRREYLMPIFELRKLRHLHLDVRLVTDSNICVPVEIVADFSRMISLESLCVGYALGVVNHTRFRMLASMPNLQELEIPNLRWDAECLKTILFGLGRKLKTLTIKDNRNCRDWALMRDRHSDVNRDTSIPAKRLRSGRQREQQEFSSLEVLKISFIPLSDVCVGRITAHHCRLRIVSFRECYNITDAGLVTLFEHEPLLEELYFSSRKNLDGTFLEGLGELCRRLRSLTVVPSKNISCEYVQEFRLRRPRVEYGR